MRTNEQEPIEASFCLPRNTHTHTHTHMHTHTQALTSWLENFITPWIILKAVPGNPAKIYRLFRAPLNNSGTQCTSLIHTHTQLTHTHSLPLQVWWLRLWAHHRKRLWAQRARGALRESHLLAHGRPHVWQLGCFLAFLKSNALHASMRQFDIIEMLSCAFWSECASHAWGSSNRDAFSCILSWMRCTQAWSVRQVL